MPHFYVTMHTPDFLRRSVDTNHQLMHEIAMAHQAILLQDPRIRSFDHDRLVKILQGEALGVMPAIVGFRQVFAEEIMRQMAVHASGDCMMARLLPGVVLRLHDMTVHTNLGIIAQVGKPFRIQERIAADAQQDTRQYGQQANRRSHDVPGAFTIIGSSTIFPSSGGSICPHAAEDEMILRSSRYNPTT